MKKRLLSRLLPIPQAVFVIEIEKVLLGILRNDEKAKIVDFPSGNGKISYALSKKFPECEFHCYDLDSSEIAYQNTYLKSKNITSQVRNITHTLKESFDIFLLINSLFLINDIESVFRNLKKAKFSIIIIPNVKTCRFQRFQNSNIGANKHLFTVDQLKKVLHQNGFKLIQSKGIVSCDVDRWGRLAKFLKYFPWIDILCKRNSKQHQYFLLVFECDKP